MAFAIQIFKNAFGQSDGGSAWCIEFVNMVRFTHSNVVCRKLVHNLCQVFVDGGENGYSQAEIRRPEQGLSLFLAKFFYLVTMLGHPSGTARNQFYTGFEGSDIVTVGYHRVGEFDRYIRRTKCFGFEIVLIIDIDNADNFMSATEGDFFQFFAHFSVAD